VRLGNLLRDVEAVAGGVDVYLLRILAVAALAKKLLLVLVGNADAGIYKEKGRRLPSIALW